MNRTDLCLVDEWIILLAMRINGITEVETTDEGQLVHLDQRMLQTPSLAVEGAKLETIRLGHIARENLELALSTLEDRDPEKISDVRLISSSSNAFTALS